MGVAVASKFLGVGSIVPAARAGVGAVATQAGANVAFKAAGLEQLSQGTSAPDCIEVLVSGDERRDHRQVGVVDSEGRSATFTGQHCSDWAGGWTAPDVAIQGNILTGPEVIDAMAAAWSQSSEASLARRLLQALAISRPPPRRSR